MLVVIYLKHVPPPSHGLGHLQRARAGPRPQAVLRDIALCPHGPGPVVTVAPTAPFCPQTCLGS